jgi:outer membrane protein OmpA-like peptidoglycan-associated protein
MYGATRWWAGLLGAALLLSGTGCQDGRDDQIRALQERLRAAEDDNTGLKAQLDDLNRNGGNAASRALQLQQMLDELTRRNNELQQQLASASNRPAPPAHTEGDWVFAGPYAWMDITEDILFDSGKAELKSSGRAKLQQVASDLKSKFMGKAYWVIGHTDTDPIVRTKDKWQDNLDLSQARARVVALELIKLGITPRELIAGGQGEWNPRGNDKSKNRRVTIMAVDRPQRVAPSALAPVQPGKRS